MKSFPSSYRVLWFLAVALPLAGCSNPLGNLTPGKVLPVAAAPVITPAAGAYTSTQTVSISDSTPGAVIYYTTDGSLPTPYSAVYTGPFKVRGVVVAANSTNPGSVVSAIAIAPGFVNSPLSFNVFDINIPAPVYSFQNVAIVAGGFVDGIFFHPTQKGLAYARTDIGGAYKYNAATASAPQTWTPLIDFTTSANQGYDLGVESIGLDPSNAQNLYISVGEYADSFGYNGEFLLSANQGATFTTVNAPFKMGSNDNGRFAGERFGVDPQNGKSIWYGSRNNGLWNSQDQGMTWTQSMTFPVLTTTGTTLDPGAGVIFEAFLPANGSANGGTANFYVGVSDPGPPNGSYNGLYVTTDGGQTFTAVPGQPTGQYPNAYWLDTVGGYLYMTYALDSGCTASTGCASIGPEGPNAGSVWQYTLPTPSNTAGTWTNITPPADGGSYGFGSVVVDPNNSKILMVTTLDRYYPPPADDIFRSTDGGVTWASIDANIVRDSSLSPWVNFGQPTAGPGNWLNHLVVDPSNSNHVMYGDGQTIWQTNNMLAADGETTTAGTISPANATNWSIGAVGIEETAITYLISPPAVTAGTPPPIELVSEMGDLGGFSFSEAMIESGLSPANGADQNPTFTSGQGADYAGAAPLTIARVGNISAVLGSSAATELGAYSTNGAVSWTPFAGLPPLAGTATGNIVQGGGSIAVSADGTIFVWVPSDNGATAYFSNDQGTTWTASTGSPQQNTGGTPTSVYADRFTASNFYILDPSNGQIYTSTDGGQTFSSSAQVNGTISLTVSPSAAGDVWANANNGLYESLDGANTFTQIDAVTSSYDTSPQVGQVAQVLALGFGAPDTAQQDTYPTIYLSGYIYENVTDTKDNTTTIQSVPGIFRCIDFTPGQTGNTWVQINGTDPSDLPNAMAPDWGGVYHITGDPNIFGRVYMGTSGRGILYGDSAN